MRRIPKHSKEELNDVAIKAQQGDTRAREELAEMMRPYVVAQMEKVRGDYTHEQREEMVQAGWVGVFRALPGFDPAAGTKFSTWAFPWIKHELYEWLARNSGSVPMSRKAWNAAKWVEKNIEPETHPADYNDATLSEVSGVPSAGAIIRARQAPFAISEDHDSADSRTTEDHIFEEWEDERDRAVVNFVGLMTDVDIDPDILESVVWDFATIWDLTDEHVQTILALLELS